MANIIQEKFPQFDPSLTEEILQHATFHTFEPGEQLMRTGQYFRSTMLILDGTVKVYREDDEGNEFLMYYLQGGQACALSMICATRQQASEVMAKAETLVNVVSIPLEYMDQWMLNYRSWYYFVLESYRMRFEELLQTIDHVVFRNMDERLIFFLKRYQDTHQTNILTISNTEIAQELNSSREVISRLMKKLSEKGMIRLLKNAQIEIIQLEA
ncbi:CRP/FNR family transcriptional regulator [Chitinophaga skermanii]|uniref:CRP/FNR family transcriptional regulator n=1 Tax=Chitinophaga skermanii TaxID=331697 RepID=A0A327QL18_9BACT|nr:Crp/Fnr family transcriptional regulator [Chitinophaga skermanii]RAJ02447.1 CRP/FNR family transcriptional regulator [Chitinophaga skermanii]